MGQQAEQWSPGAGGGVGAGYEEAPGTWESDGIDGGCVMVSICQKVHSCALGG